MGVTSAMVDHGLEMQMLDLYERLLRMTISTKGHGTPLWATLQLYDMLTESEKCLKLGSSLTKTNLCMIISQHIQGG